MRIHIPYGKFFGQDRQVRGASRWLARKKSSLITMVGGRKWARRGVPGGPRTVGDTQLGAARTEAGPESLEFGGRLGPTLTLPSRNYSISACQLPPLSITLYTYALPTRKTAPPHINYHENSTASHPKSFGIPRRGVTARRQERASSHEHPLG